MPHMLIPHHAAAARARAAAASVRCAAKVCVRLRVSGCAPVSQACRARPVKNVEGGAEQARCLQAPAK